MTAIATTVMLASLAAAETRALVVPYEVLGVEDAVVERLGNSLRSEVKKHQWSPLLAEDSAKQAKSASMCGEDAECLATIGQRAGAKWVIAYSLGKLGNSFIASTVLVEVSSGQRRSTSTEKMVVIPEDFTNVAIALCTPLFRDVPRVVELAPGKVRVVVTEAPHRLRPVGIGVLIGGGVVGIGGVILSVVAGNHYGTLAARGPEERPAADTRQRALNVGADVVIGAAIAVVATGVVLLIADAAASTQTKVVSDKPLEGADSVEAKPEEAQQ